MMDGKVFKRYLIRLREHYMMLLQVHAMSDKQRYEAEKLTFAVELLDDIIHHYDMLVKGEEEVAD
jgi:hypothetical protein